MRILLLNPTYFDRILYPPVNLAYLAASLRDAGHDVRFIDVNIEPRCRQRIIDMAPDLIGLPVMSFSSRTVTRFVDALRRIVDSRIVIGGAHVSITQEKVMDEIAADYAIIGEGEYALNELCEAIDGKRPFGSVKGLIYREGGIVKKNEIRPYNTELDKLPFPAWELMSVEKYDFLPIVDSRGCPYLCNFCCVKDVQGRKWRARSWDNIVTEIERDIRLFGKKKFYIDGDNLMVDKDRILKLCAAIKERCPGISWVATQGVRADLVSEDIFRAMRDSGCDAMGFGIESGDDSVLEKMQKGENAEKIRSSVLLAKKHGFFVTGCFMVGNKGETARTVKNSIKFMESLKLNAVYVNLVVPYPKTGLWEWVEANGMNFNKESVFFPPTLQEYRIDPSFETADFTREERIRSYRSFKKAVFWNLVRVNLFRRAILDVILWRILEVTRKAVYFFTKRTREGSVLGKCDIWEK